MAADPSSNASASPSSPELTGYTQHSRLARPPRAASRSKSTDGKTEGDDGVPRPSHLEPGFEVGPGGREDPPGPIKTCFKRFLTLLRALGRATDCSHARLEPMSRELNHGRRRRWLVMCDLMGLVLRAVASAALPVHSSGPFGVPQEMRRVDPILDRDTAGTAASSSLQKRQLLAVLHPARIEPHDVDAARRQGS